MSRDGPYSTRYLPMGGLEGPPPCPSALEWACVFGPLGRITYSRLVPQGCAARMQGPSRPM
eukprot:4633051-Pyramimonas_sp.AAC.1